MICTTGDHPLLFDEKLSPCVLEWNAPLWGVVRIWGQCWFFRGLREGTKEGEKEIKEGGEKERKREDIIFSKNIKKGYFNLIRKNEKMDVSKIEGGGGETLRPPKKINIAWGLFASDYGRSTVPHYARCVRAEVVLFCAFLVEFMLFRWF